MNVKGKVGSTHKWILLLIRANNFKSKIYRHRLGELIISLQVPRINLLMIFHVFFKHMGYFMVKAVLRSRHFFGRLRIQTSEFPEPAPAPGKKYGSGSRQKRAASGGSGSCH